LAIAARSYCFETWRNSTVAAVDERADKAVAAVVGAPPAVAIVVALEVPIAPLASSFVIGAP